MILIARLYIIYKAPFPLLVSLKNYHHPWIAAIDLVSVERGIMASFPHPFFVFKFYLFSLIFAA